MREWSLCSSWFVVGRLLYLAYEFALVGPMLSGCEQAILAALTGDRAVLPPNRKANDTSQLRLWRPTSAPLFTALGSAA